MELGPDELLDFSSDLTEALRPAIGPLSPGTQRMVVGPSAQAEARKLHLKLTIVLHEDHVEYPFVEFAIVRSGQDEIEIQSCSPNLPLKISLVFNHMDRTGKFDASCRFVGKDIRAVFKASNAVSFRQGCMKSPPDNC